MVKKMIVNQDEVETLEVEMFISKPSERELNILSDFIGVEDFRKGDSYTLKYCINIQYLFGIRNRLKSVIGLMKAKRNRITISKLTQLKSQALVVVDYCNTLVKLKTERK